MHEVPGGMFNSVKDTIMKQHDIRFIQNFLLAGALSDAVQNSHLPDERHHHVHNLLPPKIRCVESLSLAMLR